MAAPSESAGSAHTRTAQDSQPVNYDDDYTNAASGGRSRRLSVLQPQSHSFDAHDVRETAARFRYPAPRQHWYEREDGTRVNSADTDRRGMPPYLLILDLVFAALCGLCANSIELYSLAGVPRFFMLFFSFSWIWVLLNTRLNCFDPEDVSFERFGKSNET